MTNNLSRSPRLIAVYGSLRRGQRANHYLNNDSFDYVGTDYVKGTLFPVGWFPGIQLFGDTPVVVDVYEILDENALDNIHHYEGYLPDNPMGSLFVPKQVTLINSQKEAMCYEYNGRFGAAGDIVEHGDWARYLEEKAAEGVLSERDSGQAA